MSRDSSASTAHLATCLVLLASTANVPAALRATKIRAEREGLDFLNDDDIRRAILTIRSQAAAALANFPLSDAPSNALYAGLGLADGKVLP